MGKKDFMKKTVVSIAGTFRTSPEKMRKWVERVGGRFYTTIHKDTTHLVVSDHAWKKQDAIGMPLKTTIFISTHVTSTNETTQS